MGFLPHACKTGLRRFLGIWGDVGFRIYIQGSGTQGLLEASELLVENGGKPRIVLTGARTQVPDPEEMENAAPLGCTWRFMGKKLAPCSDCLPTSPNQREPDTP